MEERWGSEGEKQRKADHIPQAANSCWFLSKEMLQWFVKAFSWLCRTYWRGTSPRREPTSRLASRSPDKYSPVPCGNVLGFRLTPTDTCDVDNT